MKCYFRDCKRNYDLLNTHTCVYGVYPSYASAIDKLKVDPG